MQHCSAGRDEQPYHSHNFTQQGEWMDAMEWNMICLLGVIVVSP
jgi:hypothetical protein